MYDLSILAYILLIRESESRKISRPQYRSFDTVVIFNNYLLKPYRFTMIDMIAIVR